VLNQGGALVNVFNDGSISVNHGGTEMGQGLNTKMAQVAASGLGVPWSWVRVTGTDTQKVPNASATAASAAAPTSTAPPFNNACDQLRARLAQVAAGKLGCSAADVVLAGGQASANGQSIAWKDLVKQAWLDRVGLSVTGFYKTPEIGYDFATLTGHAFYYFCYGAAVTETEIDTLTGEWWCQRVDIVHDVGRSINPAIDRGQIEGAYIQGLGWHDDGRVHLGQQAASC
jgi:xanthine dehydrogenase large subunit